jgi:hypothetical protein
MPVSLANALAQIQTTASRKREGRRVSLIFEVPWPLRLWHLASLDAPSVAVVWSLAFAHTANVHLPVWCPLLIAVATWSVYLGDRLLDAHFAISTGDLTYLRERHYFHWHHRRAMTPLAIAAAVIAGVILLALMPVVMRERGCVVGIAALAYFSGVHLPQGQATRRLRFISKEFLVGLLFTAGCALPSLSCLGETQSHSTTRWPFVIVIVFFVLLGWLNCHAIERWESGGLSHIREKAILIAVAGFFLAMFFHHFALTASAALVAGSTAAVLLGLLDHFRGRMTALTLRIAADLSLLTPVFLIIR